MFKKFQIIAILAISVLGFGLTVNSFARAEVTPEEVKPNADQSFILGISALKETPTVKIRLVVPDEVSEVIPNVKLGWNIQVNKDGDKVKEIVWQGGIIPKDQRDEFGFALKTPSKESELKWKVYQTYQDGVEVSWDQEPSDDKKDITPYGTTKVSANTHFTESGKDTKNTNNTLFGVSAVSGLVISVVALGMALKNTDKK